VPMKAVEKNTDVELVDRTARHGGSAACYNRDTTSLDRFQAQPIWEMSVNITKY